MTVSLEPRGLNWINNLNTNSFGSLVSQLCWLVGSLVLTKANYHLLMSDNELARQAGLFLTGILVASWTGKSVIGTVDRSIKRKTHPLYKEVLEAQERGKVAGAAAASIIAENKLDLQAARGRVRTAEHAAQVPAPVAQPAAEVNVTNISGKVG